MEKVLDRTTVRLRHLYDGTLFVSKGAEEKHCPPFQLCIKLTSLNCGVPMARVLTGPNAGLEVYASEMTVFPASLDERKDGQSCLELSFIPPFTFWEKRENEPPTGDEDDDAVDPGEPEEIAAATAAAPPEPNFCECPLCTEEDEEEIDDCCEDGDCSACIEDDEEDEEEEGPGFPDSNWFCHCNVCEERGGTYADEDDDDDEDDDVPDTDPIDDDELEPINTENPFTAIGQLLNQLAAISSSQKLELAGIRLELQEKTAEWNEYLDELRGENVKLALKLDSTKNELVGAYGQVRRLEEKLQAIRPLLNEVATRHVANVGHVHSNALIAMMKLGPSSEFAEDFRRLFEKLQGINGPLNDLLKIVDSPVD